MTADEREQHTRQMLAHCEKVQKQFRLDNAEFDASCRKFWRFMQTAELVDDEHG